MHAEQAAPRKALMNKAIKEGRRVEAPRFGVDEDICTGDHACMRLSGCPSLSLKKLDDPLRDDPVASIDQSCVGCGNCGEVADAAVLCPSFYRADVVHNPGWFERALGSFGKPIAWLQNRRAAAARIRPDLTHGSKNQTPQIQGPTRASTRSSSWRSWPSAARAAAC
jgi:NAD-dependent dihydropyrimidine dehydrogenase PreA subunit